MGHYRTRQEIADEIMGRPTSIRRISAPAPPRGPWTAHPTLGPVSPEEMEQAETIHRGFPIAA